MQKHGETVGAPKILSKVVLNQLKVTLENLGYPIKNVLKWNKFKMLINVMWFDVI